MNFNISKMVCPVGVNSFLMQTLPFVPTDLHRYWPRDWKRSIKAKWFGILTCTKPRQPLQVIKFLTEKLHHVLRHHHLVSVSRFETNCMKNTISYLPRTKTSLFVDENVRAREGGKETTGFACRLCPSHGPLRFITSRSPLPCEKRSTWGGGWSHTEDPLLGIVRSLHG